jgi:large subunit ribosomal protein L21
MKKAVINTGGKQYLVTEGEQLDIGLLKDATKQLKFEPLLLINDDAVSVGLPTLSGKTVTAEVINPSFKGEKVIAIRYKPKKRVHKIRGHRQDFSCIVIKKID